MLRAVAWREARRAFCWILAAVLACQAFGPLMLRAQPRAHFHPASSATGAAQRIDLNAVLAHAPGLGHGHEHGHVHAEQHAHDAGSDAIDLDAGDANPRSLDLPAPWPARPPGMARLGATPLPDAADEPFRSRTTPPPDEPPRG